ncbi:SMP-30/gluconolactonase/LRE family protein [soil metagenome]
MSRHFLLALLLPITAPAQSPVIADGAELQKLAGDYAFTEGPATDAKGDVYFTDQPNDRIVKWSAADGSVADWMKPAGRSNGLYFDAEWNLLACADEKNQLWSIAPDKSVTVLVEDLDGKLLNGPNDLWVHPGGAIYFTDPLYKRGYWERDGESQLDGRHVYLLKSPGAAPVAVATDLKQPNGIIGTPDGKTLYVADPGAKKTYAYDIAEDGKLGNKRLFCESGSDGMTLDAEGNVYLTSGGVIVFDKSGKKIEQIDLPDGGATNVTFAGPDRMLLFITARKSNFGLDMKVAGAR